MQVSSACQNRQSLVGGVTADVGTKGDGMSVFREKIKVSTVGIVHKQKHIMFFADIGESLYIQGIAQIIGTCNVK